MDFLIWIDNNLQTISTWAVIIGVPIALLQLWQGNRLANKDYLRRRKEISIDKITNLENSSEEISYETYCNNPEIDESVTQYLRLMERISVGLNNDVYDFYIFRKICGRRILEYWDRFKEIVFQLRKDSGNKNLYIEYEAVAKRIREIIAKEQRTNR